MVQVSFAVFIKWDQGSSQRCYWLQKRQEKGPLNQLWEFPGGKLESGESPAQACLREVREEVGYELQEAQLQLFKIYPYHYADRAVCLYPFLVWAPEFAYQKGQWWNEDQFEASAVSMPEANMQIMKEIIVYLKGQAGLWEQQWQK